MDLKVRYNTEIDDIELVVDDKVLDTVGKDVVESWITFYNEKHGYSKNVSEVQTEEKEEEETNEQVKEDEGASSSTEEQSTKED